MDEENEQDQAGGEIDEKVMASVYYTVAKICEQEGAKLGVQISKQFISSLTELMIQYAARMAGDIGMFAKHARRNRVQPEDVYLFLRKTPDMIAVIKDFLEEEAAADKVKKPKKRARDEKTNEHEEHEGADFEGDENADDIHDLEREVIPEEYIHDDVGVFDDGNEGDGGNGLLDDEFDE
eukprot:TRINITY_DN6220_c0_g2_i1.p1 TRINITY_DN6220_c0_g2~~TRINITY_DN6220_c0_g2_i1.p1  ORF type:complete len:180 (-),score=73.04 TRINITY_DN6220_c0_g2_i1:188-727(-)